MKKKTQNNQINQINQNQIYSPETSNAFVTRVTAGSGFEQKKMSDSILELNIYNCIRFKIEH